LRDLLSNTGSWTDLGCDRVGGRKITRLRAGIERICYARGVREKSGVVASVYYTRDWRAANFDTGWF
jgi:hypothetical protein